MRNNLTKVLLTLVLIVALASTCAILAFAETSPANGIAAEAGNVDASSNSVSEETHYCEKAGADKANAFFMQDGVIYSGCTACSYVADAYKIKGDGLLDLDFDYATDETIDDYLPDGVTVRSKNNLSYVTKGDRQVVKLNELWLDDSENHLFFTPDFTMVSFDIMFEENDLTSLARESIFTFILGKQGVTPQDNVAWQYVLCYGKKEDGTEYIFSGDSITDTNSIEIENGDWYHCTIVADSSYYYIFVGDTLLGVIGRKDYTDEKYKDGTYIRFANAKNSTPCFDDVVICEIEKVASSVIVESKTVDAGEQFEVVISAKDVVSAKSMLIDEFVYDSALELVSAKWNIDSELKDWDNSEKVGVIAFDKNIPLEGPVLTLTFKTAKDAGGTFNIGCSVAINRRIGVDDVPVEFETVEGEIIVIPYIRGDMNKDGELNTDDAIRLLRYVLTPTRYPVEQCGDVDGSRTVTTNDAIYLLRHVLSPEGYPLACDGEHTFAANKVYTAVSNGFTLPCTACGHNILYKTQTPVFDLDFESDIATDSSNNIGLSIHSANAWTGKITTHNNSNAIKIGGGSPLYINIDDPTKLTALGLIEISFDYTSTNTAVAGSAASVFSLLNNFYSGANTGAGTTGWGWYLKYIEDSDKLASATSNLSDSNSISVPHNTTHKVRMLVNPASTAISVYVDGTYIGQSKQGVAINTLAAKNACFRFGDGPDCGHVFDNFTISAVE